jgi:hypothetical protein
MHIEAINLLTGEATSDMAPIVVGVYWWKKYLFIYYFLLYHTLKF